MLIFFFFKEIWFSVAMMFSSWVKLWFKDLVFCSQSLLSWLKLLYVYYSLASLHLSLHPSVSQAPKVCKVPKGPVLRTQPH